jgi:dethiobiotin synthetase
MSADNNTTAIFVTGTDTGIGKTLVTAALAQHFRSKGLEVGVMKPVETGIKEPADLGPDGTLLRWAAQSTDPDDDLSPYRFALAASPYQAAKAEGTQIEPEKILNAFEKIKQGKDIVLVEGAGGLMVPLRGGFLMSDLVQEMKIPALIVTHPALGTLNHTLLTTFAARAMALTVCGFIINRMPAAPDAIEAEAPHLLSSIASADLLGVFPEVSGTETNKVEALSKEISDLPTYHWLASALGLQG